MEIQTVGVAGAGTMGAGIAQLFAQNNFQVQLFDVSEDILAHARERMIRSLERVKKPQALSFVRMTTRLDDFVDCDFVIEAVSETLSIKQDVFKRLGILVPSPRILATNTSSLPVTRIAEVAQNPERVVGMHFFNPVVVMRLVEVVRAQRTDERTVQRAAALAQRLGKTVVFCRDTPGFIANRVIRPFFFGGMRLLEGGAGSIVAIDGAMKTLGGFKMGPFELMDLIGLDVNFSISSFIYESLGRPERLKPCRVQAELVARHDFGRKTSRGFYLYGEKIPSQTVNPALEEIVSGIGSKPVAGEQMMRTILEGIVQEAKLAVKEGIATSHDIDTAMLLGMNWPKGPFEWDKDILRLGVS